MNPSLARLLAVLLLLVPAWPAQAFWTLDGDRWQATPALLQAPAGATTEVPLPDGPCPARLNGRGPGLLGGQVVRGRLLPPCAGTFLLHHGASGWRGWVDLGDARLRLAGGHLRPLEGRAPQGTGDTRLIPRRTADALAPAAVPDARAQTATVRVLVLVSASYAGRYPGSALGDRIDALFAYANQGLADSAAPLVLVPDPAPDPIDLPDTVSDQAALDDLLAGRPPFAAVAALRDAREADLVVLLRPLSDGRGSLCGQAPQNGAGGTPLDPQLAYAVVRLEHDAQGFLCEDLALPHMLGHLMGLAHDPANADQDGALPYAHGYGEAGLFGTVMGMIAPWINRWSSPLQTCAGRPCGSDGLADNVRALTELAPQVAAFRGTAPAPVGEPRLSTEPADAIGPAGATLNGTVDPAGAPLDVYFRYGPDLTLGARTPVQSVPGVEAPVPVSAVVEGLACDSRYFYRLEGVRDGRVYSALNGQFTTAPCDTPPAPPLTVPAPQVSGVGRASATFSVQLDPPGETLQVRFLYGRGGVLDRATEAVTVDAASATTRIDRFVNGLACATDYQVQVVLERADGSRLDGPLTPFTTLACAAATGPVLTLEPLDVGIDQAVVAASIDAEGVPTLAWFEYGPPQNPALWRTAAVNIGQATRPKTLRATLTGLACATTYAYRAVSATDDGSGAGVDPVLGDTLSFTTLDCPLPEIRDERLVWANAHDAALAATVDSHGQPGEVVFQYGLSPGFGEFSPSQPLAGLHQQVVLSGLECGRLYYFRAVVTVGQRVVTGAGNSFATAPCPGPPEVATVPGPEVTATSAALRARVVPNGAATRVWFEYGPDSGYGAQTPVRSLPGDSPGAEVETWVLDLDCGREYHFRAWAENDQGRLAGDDQAFATAPCRPPAQAPAPRLAAGLAHTLARGADGALLAWGDDSRGQSGGASLPHVLPGPRTVARVAAGADFGLALDGAGRLWSWGAGERGQLGDGTLDDRAEPQPVLQGVQAVAAGRAHALALDGAGRIQAWGAGERGQLGDGEARDSPLPVPVDLAVPVVAVAAGGDHSLAVDGRGRLWVWGDNRRGQLGVGDVERVLRPRLGSLDGVLAVAAGGDFSLALRRDGTLWTWGGNERGQLGDGTFTDRARPRPLRDAEGRLVFDVVALAAGAAHALALRADGSVLAWGANDADQAGVPGGEDQALPQTVSGPDGPLGALRGVAAGGAHSLALAADGGVWGWGDNGLGQLGAGVAGGPRAARLAGPDGPLRLAASRLLVDPPAPRVVEGGEVEIRVRPDGEPLGPLFVSLRLEDDQGRLTLADPRPLQFDAADWAAPQTLRLAAVPDQDSADQRVTLVLFAPGLPETRLTVLVEDRDAPPARAALAPAALLLLLAAKRKRAARGGP